MKNEIVEYKNETYIIDEVTETFVKAFRYIFNTNTSKYEKTGDSVQLKGDYSIVPLSIVRIKNSVSNVEESSELDELTKPEIMKMLDKQKTKYNPRDKREVLLELLRGE